MPSQVRYNVLLMVSVVPELVLRNVCCLRVELTRLTVVWCLEQLAECGQLIYVTPDNTLFVMNWDNCSIKGQNLRKIRKNTDNRQNV